jgi:hypothetical protein
MIMNVYLGEDRLPEEKNDCTVISLSYACNISYADSYVICKAFGRKPKKSFNLNKVFRIKFSKKRNVKRTFAGNKYEIIYYARPHMTVRSLKKHCPIGNFICIVANHAFCIKDGIVFNLKNENKKIKYFFEVKRITTR